MGETQTLTRLFSRAGVGEENLRGCGFGFCKTRPVAIPSRGVRWVKISNEDLEFLFEDEEEDYVVVGDNVWEKKNVGNDWRKS